jgi:hypothetical protein
VTPNRVRELGALERKHAELLPALRRRVRRHDVDNDANGAE